jgi:hypothetical protein
MDYWIGGLMEEADGKMLPVVASVLPEMLPL